MLKQAKIKLKSLIYDDSGVAMAYTIMVFLFFFMLCVSTYAMSENIRKKMELQNACDAAAYSGAVVQADMLSRLAVLNRALSWTYAETNKRHMDAVVDDWLRRVVIRYSSIASAARNAYRNNSTCATNACFNNNNQPCRPDCGGVCGNIGWFAGWSSNAGSVRLNNSRTVAVNAIRNARAAYTRRSDLMIRNGYTNITTLNNEINNIRININTYIGQAIRYSMGAFPVARFSFFIDGRWGGSPNAATYIVPQTTEGSFLNYSGTTAAAAFSTGRNTWWGLTTSNTGWWGIAADGFTRRYRTGFPALAATGSAFANRHFHVPVGFYPTIFWRHVSRRISNGNIEPQPPAGQSSLQLNIAGAQIVAPVSAARPAMLAQAFFGRAGSIIVTAKDPVINPFSGLFGADAGRGVYGAFNGFGRDMWVVSAARAGIRLAGDAAGLYRVQYPGATFAGYTARTWNLCEEDWDAVMIPVNRAWDNTTAVGWGTANADATTNALLTAARGALDGVNSDYGRRNNIYVTPSNPVRH